MYRKKFLPKLVIASLLVNGINFSPVIVNFDEKNLQIVSVAYAAVENVTANGTAMFDFGDDDEKIVNLVKDIAKMRATQAAKEKAGIYVKSQTKTVNSVLTEDDISAYTSNNITILDVQYKKVPVQVHDAQGNDTGQIGFMYEVTLNAKIDTSGLTEYAQRDYQERQNLIQQDKSSQQYIDKIVADFENLRTTSENKTSEQIYSEITKIYNGILAQRKVDDGWVEWYGGNYEKSVGIFNEAINLDPNDFEGYYGRGTAYLHLKKYSQAISDFNKVIQINPNHYTAYNNLGVAYLDGSKNYSEAISYFNKAIQLNSSLDFAYFNRGFTYINLQNYSQAISDFTNALQLNPNHTKAYVNRGLAYRELKNYSQAISDLTQAIKLNPNDEKAYYNRGTTYQAYLENDVQAISDFTKAIQLNPNNFEAYNNRGVSYFMLQKYSEAIFDFNKAIQINPNYALSYYSLGVYYKTFGDNAKAESYFAKARQLGYSR